MSRIPDELNERIALILEAVEKHNMTQSSESNKKRKVTKRKKAEPISIAEDRYYNLHVINHPEKSDTNQLQLSLGKRIIRTFRELLQNGVISLNVKYNELPKNYKDFKKREDVDTYIKKYSKLDTSGKDQKQEKMIERIKNKYNVNVICENDIDELKRDFSSDLQSGLTNYLLEYKNKGIGLAYFGRDVYEYAKSCVLSTLAENLLQEYNPQREAMFWHAIGNFSGNIYKKGDYSKTNYKDIRKLALHFPSSMIVSELNLKLGLIPNSRLSMPALLDQRVDTTNKIIQYKDYYKESTSYLEVFGGDHKFGRSISGNGIPHSFIWSCGRGYDRNDSTSSHFQNYYEKLSKALFKSTNNEPLDLTSAKSEVLGVFFKKDGKPLGKLNPRKNDRDELYRKFDSKKPLNDEEQLTLMYRRYLGIKIKQAKIITEHYNKINKDKKPQDVIGTGSCMVLSDKKIKIPSAAQSIRLGVVNNLYVLEKHLEELYKELGI